MTRITVVIVEERLSPEALRWREVNDMKHAGNYKLLLFMADLPRITPDEIRTSLSYVALAEGVSGRRVCELVLEMLDTEPETLEAVNADVLKVLKDIGQMRVLGFALN